MLQSVRLEPLPEGISEELRPEFERLAAALLSIGVHVWTLQRDDALEISETERGEVGDGSGGAPTAGFVALKVIR